MARPSARRSTSPAGARHARACRSSTWAGAGRRSVVLRLGLRRGQACARQAGVDGGARARPGGRPRDVEHLRRRRRARPARGRCRARGRLSALRLLADVRRGRGVARRSRSRERRAEAVARDEDLGRLGRGGPRAVRETSCAGSAASRSSRCTTSSAGRSTCRGSRRSETRDGSTGSASRTGRRRRVRRARPGAADRPVLGAPGAVQPARAGVRA